MPFDQVIVWIDHVQAHVIHFNPEASESEVVKLHTTHHAASGISSGADPAAARYLEEVAGTLKNAASILLVGPGLEKLVLMKHLSKHEPLVADHVVSVETVDHPTDGQLLAYARKYFAAGD